MSRNKTFIIGVICVLLMCISGIYAFTNTSVVTVKDEINTGAINIELNEYTVENNGTENLYEEQEQSVYPGQVISLIPRISNKGDSSYVRAKINYASEEGSAILLSDENVKGINSKLKRIGEYWYYTEIVEPGQSIDLFDSVQIPTDISNDLQGEVIQLNIIAEAVQAEHFQPDFNSLSPWNGVEAKKGTDESYKFDKVQLSQTAKVEYLNNAQLNIDVPDNFFGKLNHVVPGDLLIEKVIINNTSKADQEYLFSVKANTAISEKEYNLLNQLKLTVTSDSGKEIYSGKLYDVVNKSLGNYKPGEKENITFEIEVPTSLENEFANINTEINWVFAIKELEQAPEEPKKEETIIEKIIPIEKSPQTGDVKFIVAITIFIVAAIGFIVVLVIEKKKKIKSNNI